MFGQLDYVAGYMIVIQPAYLDRDLWVDGYWECIECKVTKETPVGFVHAVGCTRGKQ